MFFAAYLTLIRVRKIGLNGGVVRVGVLDLGGVWGCGGYHTIGQVCAGAVLGAGLGGAWFWVVDRVLRGWFEITSVLLMSIDASVIPELQLALQNHSDSEAVILIEDGA
ncbi:Lipid phosphate phosphatase gamma-like protein [Drosera capensis]